MNQRDVPVPGARTRGERGESSASYLAIVLLIAAILAAIVSSGTAAVVAQGIEAAICRVINPGSTCPTPAPKVPTITEPQMNCLVSNEQEYWDNYLAGHFEIWGVWGVGESQMKYRHLITPDGKDLWQVWDDSFTGAGASAGIKGGEAFAWGIYEKSKIYQFSNEKDARAFYDKWKAARLGAGGVKAAVRTNPLTGWAVNLAGKLPWVGSKIQDITGSATPKESPAMEYHGIGVMGGVFNDVAIGKLSIPLKGAAWGLAEAGKLDDHTTGNTTYYLQGMLKIHQVMAPEAVVDDALPNAVIAKIYGIPVELVPLVKSAAAAEAAVPIANMHAGVGLRLMPNVQLGFTVDKSGHLVSVSLLFDLQYDLVARVGGSVGGDVGGVGVNAGYWQNTSIPGTGGRIRATMNLDIKDKDVAALGSKLATDLVHLQGGQAVSDLGQYVADNGTLAVVKYGNDVTTRNPSIGVGPVSLDFQEEAVNSPGEWAAFYDPHSGVFHNWNRCGLKGAPSWLIGG